MQITLEMVDEVIDRTGVSYRLAKDTLEKFDGDVVESIIYLEESKAAPNDEKKEKILNGQEIVDRLKALVNEGLVNQIIIERKGKIILEIPIVAGAISAIIFVTPTVAAIIAAVATGCEIKIVKKDGGIINFNEMTQEKYEDIKSKLKKDAPVHYEEFNDEDGFDESQETDSFFVDDDDVVEVKTDDTNNY